MFPQDQRSFDDSKNKKPSITAGEIEGLMLKWNTSHLLFRRERVTRRVQPRAYNEHETKRLLASGFIPTTLPSPRFSLGVALGLRIRLQRRDRIRFSRTSVLASRLLVAKELAGRYQNTPARQALYLQSSGRATSPRELSPNTARGMRAPNRRCVHRKSTPCSPYLAALRRILPSTN